LRLPFFYGWLIVAIGFVTMSIGVNARTGFSLLYPPILAEFGWDRALTAGAFSFGFLVTAVASPLLGRAMDRYGPRVCVELGVAMMGAGLLLAALGTEPWHFYATLGVLVGAGSICLGYNGQALFVPNWFVRRRALAISITYAGVGIGSITLLPWLQTVIDGGGWRTACTSMGLLILVVLAPLNLLLAKRPADLGLQPDGDAAPVAGGPARRSNVVDAAWAAVAWTPRLAVRTARFWWVAAALFFALYAWYAVQVHQTKYLVEIGFDASLAAWALGLVSLVAVPGQIALGHISDRIGREAVWTVGCVGFALCYALLLALQAAPSPLLLYTMVAAQGFLGYGMTSVMGPIVQEIFEGPRYGAIFGLLMVFSIVGGATGPWLTGLLYDLHGDYGLAFAIGIGCAVISAFAMWRASPGKVRAVAGRVG
jgi:MFS family permease